uniref:Uncharacterized protein n=1 Tax=Arundo donax TaxID=35708 RepID=A0A0A9BQP9_ARUDO
MMLRFSVSHISGIPDANSFCKFLMCRFRGSR